MGANSRRLLFGNITIVVDAPTTTVPDAAGFPLSSTCTAQRFYCTNPTTAPAQHAAENGQDGGSLHAQAPLS